jgi:1-acyl-sn-glycerol-3-phosphate acyltransferase
MTLIKLWLTQLGGFLFSWVLRTLTVLFTGVIARGQVPQRPDKPRIYYGNHSSHLDFMVIWTALSAPNRKRTRPVAGADYWEKGPIRKFIAHHVIHALLVDRDDADKRKLAVPKMLAALDAGDSLILFPEGTRGDGSQIGEFKRGLYAVASERPMVECVPVYLSSLSRSLPKGVVIPVPVAGKAYFAAPIYCTESGHEGDDDAFLVRAREALVNAGKQL